MLVENSPAPVKDDRQPCIERFRKISLLPGLLAPARKSGLENLVCQRFDRVVRPLFFFFFHSENTGLRRVCVCVSPVSNLICENRHAPLAWGCLDN